MVIEGGGMAGFTGAPAMSKPAIYNHAFRHEGIGGLCEVEPVGPLEYLAGKGEGRYHQAVPVGEDFIVLFRADAAGAGFEECPAVFRKVGLGYLVEKVHCV